MRLSLTLPAALALLGVSAWPAPAADQRRTALVVLKRPAGASGGSNASAGAVVARNSLVRARPDVGPIGLVTAALPAGERFANFARRINRDPAVARVERDLKRHLRLVPNDPALTIVDPAGPGFAYQWNVLRQNLPAAWDIAQGAGVKVGIIDTGIDKTHPDLAPQVVAAVNQTRSHDDVTDRVGHGTHVAGLACGAAGNAAGVAGSGYGCRLVVEKTDLTGSSIAASLVDATRRGAKVINMSWGGSRRTFAEHRALVYAIKHDVVLVAAASDRAAVNQGHPASDLQPSGTGPKLAKGRGLVVTAADSTGRRAFFAGQGSQISLAAYGFTSAGPPGIFSTFPANRTLLETGTGGGRHPCVDCRVTFNGDSRYGYLFGTSMAAPQVAGVAALVRSANPSLPARDVVRIIKESASQATWSAQLGWGIVDAGAAVAMAPGYEASSAR